MTRKIQMSVIVILIVILSVLFVALSGEVFDTLGLSFGIEQAILTFGAGLIGGKMLLKP